MLLGLQHSQAQDLGNSPYSRIGLGELSSAPGNIRNFGMGNVGVATPNGANAQVQNPALLYYVNRVSFEMAGSGQVKSISNAQESKTAGNGGLTYLALSVPVTKFWRSAIGLRPFSAVNYSTSQRSMARNTTTPVLLGNSGEGIISEAYFSNGVRLLKGLTVGVTGSYLFGAIDKNAYSQLQDSLGVANGTQVVFNEHINYSDLVFKSGISYRQSLGKKVNATLAGVYGFETQLDAKVKSLLLHRRSSDQFVITETPLSADAITKRQVTLPGFWEAGLSFDNANSWVIGAEVSARNWSAYQGEGAEKLRNSLRLGIGGEYVPDATSVDSYLKRVAYQAGFSYNKTPYFDKGQQINDKSVHAGLSLPIGSVPRPPEYNQSFINLGLAVGQQGTTSNGLIQEKYVRFMIGLTLNSSWFIKPKFE